MGADPVADAVAALERLRARDAALVREGPGHPGFGPAFMRRYLPHYMVDPETGLATPPAEWHPELFRLVFGLLGSGRKLAVLAPRGYAKSTIASLGLVLAALALQLKRYVWLIQDTGEQAKLAMEGVVGELETNERLLADFPHLAGRYVVDRDLDIVLPSGARFQALGAGMKVRGRRHRQWRPDLAVFDDLENDQHVLTKYQRDKLDSWVGSAALAALAPHADAVYLGTMLHHDGQVARLMRNDGWEHVRFEALHDPDDLSTSTWPEYWTEPRLRARRGAMGIRAFNREFLHVVADTDSLMFDPAHFRYGQPRGERVRIGVDPAFSEKGVPAGKKSDRSAVVVVSRVEGEPDVYVRQAWAGRKRGTKLMDVIEHAYREHGGYVVFERVQAQEWGAQALEERGIPVRRVTPAVDKVTRAEPVSILYENRRVVHDESLRGSEFEAELEQFPNGEHDDYVDALVYAVKDLAGEPGAGSSAAVVNRAARAGDEEFYDPRYA